VTPSTSAAIDRLERAFTSDWTIGDIVAFHTREKFLILAHDEASYRKLGPLVAGSRTIPREEFEREYRRLFLIALGSPPTVGSHTNVLQHMLGFLADTGDIDARSTVNEAIEAFRLGDEDLSVPLEAIRQNAKQHNIQLLMNSTYLSSHVR